MKSQQEILDHLRDNNFVISQRFWDYNINIDIIDFESKHVYYSVNNKVQRIKFENVIVTNKNYEADFISYLKDFNFITEAEMVKLRHNYNFEYKIVSLENLPFNLEPIGMYYDELSHMTYTLYSNSIDTVYIL